MPSASPDPSFREVRVGDTEGATSADAQFGQNRLPSGAWLEQEVQIGIREDCHSAARRGSASLLWQGKSLRNNRLREGEGTPRIG